MSERVECWGVREVKGLNVGGWGWMRGLNVEGADERGFNVGGGEWR